MTLIDTETAALILQVTPRHVRNFVTTGILTNRGTPRCIKLDVDDVEQLRTLRGHTWGLDRFPLASA